MPTLSELLPVRIQARILRGLLRLPDPALHLLAGKPIRLDGQQLNVEAQLLLKLERLVVRELRSQVPAIARQRMKRGTPLVAGPRVQPVELHEFGIPGPESTLRVRLYTPKGLPPGSPLLVYFHGGGWVVGDLDTHDNLCRYLAKHAGVRVLAVDYRLAPEHPFPAAVDDALAAYRYAVAHAREWDADPDAIALGGDSAGGNLAAVTAHQVAGLPEVQPKFLLLFYPGVDAVQRRPSRDLFGEGFFLTETEINWYRDQYLPDPASYGDPRVSVARADHLADLPPTYLVTAGFDPLRDDGEAFAAKLSAQGVPVVLRRHEDLFHGFANVLGPGRRCREAVSEAAVALRVGIGLRRRIPHPLHDATTDVS